MKTLGLIGGMSWESTAIYYRLLNAGVKARLGGYHSAKMIIYSVDFAEIEELQRTNQWEEAGRRMAAAAQSLHRGGAECIVLSANTMHKVASAIEAAVPIPLLHIVDATAEAIKATGIDTVGLLATRFTMEHDFYIGRLRDKHGIKAIVPDPDERAEIHRVIYHELVQGQVLESSRNAFLAVVDRLKAKGARGIILGCTEIPLLIGPDTLELPCFDTAALHAASAVSYCLSESRAA
jgi:aspartate racemase